LIRLLYDDRGGGSDGSERPDRQTAVDCGGGHRDVPPEVTVDRDEVEEGAVVVVVVTGDPASSCDVVDEALVVEVVSLPVVAAAPPFDVVDVVSEDVASLDPGCSRDTTTATTAVAAVAASTAPRVRLRRRDCARALLWGLWSSGGRDIDWQPLLAERHHPNTADSTPALDALWPSCDIRAP
jgi:hypothetical protein